MIYDHEFIQTLFDEISDAQHPESVYSLSVKSLDVFKKPSVLAGTVINDHFQNYLNLSELQKMSRKNLSKLSKLDTAITNELSQEKPDFMELECKLKEYEMIEHDQRKYVQPRILQAASKDWMTRMDNL